MIDYAHNAMSLKSLLATLREYQPARLVCLFGCGGNRSRLRRFEMGEVSGTYADCIWEASTWKCLHTAMAVRALYTLNRPGVGTST
mgnify:CR=1 FL=1